MGIVCSSGLTKRAQLPAARGSGLPTPTTSFSIAGVAGQLAACDSGGLKQNIGPRQQQQCQHGEPEKGGGGWSSGSLQNENKEGDGQQEAVPQTWSREVHDGTCREAEAK